MRIVVEVGEEGWVLWGRWRRSSAIKKEPERKAAAEYFEKLDEGSKGRVARGTVWLSSKQ